MLVLTLPFQINSNRTQNSEESVFDVCCNFVFGWTHLKGTLIKTSDFLLFTIFFFSFIVSAQNVSFYLFPFERRHSAKCWDIQGKIQWNASHKNIFK